MSAHWTVTVDRGACLGSGMCTAIAPDRFRLDGGTSHPVDETIAPDDDVIDAANSTSTPARLRMWRSASIS